MSTPCPECCTDAAAWGVQDCRTTLADLGGLWHGMLDGLDPTAAERAVGALRRDADDALVALTGAADAAAARAAAADLGPDRLAEAVHAALHALRLAGRRLAAAGLLGRPQHGEVVQVSASGGGVPKTALDKAEVGARGLVGDSQNSRRHHGRPFQALCLWSGEVIARLQAEGHPIGAGSAGENLTVTGLDWDRVRPGQRWEVGTVVAETSSWAVPCRHQARWFRDGDFRRILHDEHPGFSRAYAWVVRPGVVAPGDAVRVLP